MSVKYVVDLHALPRARLYHDMSDVGLDFQAFDAVERPLVLNDEDRPYYQRHEDALD